MYRVLLYYQYVPIDDPETFASEHKLFCQKLELKGRILVAKEGINGTVSGTVEQTERYMQAMKEDVRAASMERIGREIDLLQVRLRSQKNGKAENGRAEGVNPSEGR